MSTTVFKKKKVAANTDEIAMLVLRLSYVLEPLGELYKHPSARATPQTKPITLCEGSTQASVSFNLPRGLLCVAVSESHCSRTRFSNWGPRASTISPTGELVLHPDSLDLKPEGGARGLCFDEPSRWSSCSRWGTRVPEGASKPRASGWETPPMQTHQHPQEKEMGGWP